MTAWALFCHDFDLSKGINILSEKCPVVLDHYTLHGAGHGEQGGVQDIEFGDFLHIGAGHALGDGLCFDLCGQFVAFFSLSFWNS